METEKAVEQKRALVRPGGVLATALIAAQAQSIAMATAKTNKESEQASARELSEGAAEYCLPDGTVLATDEFQDGRPSVDVNRLAKEFPQAYLACVTAGEPFRVMRFKSAMMLLAGSHTAAMAKRKTG